MRKPLKTYLLTAHGTKNTTPGHALSKLATFLPAALIRDVVVSHHPSCAFHVSPQITTLAIILSILILACLFMCSSISSNWLCYWSQKFCLTVLIFMLHCVAI